MNSISALQKAIRSQKFASPAEARSWLMAHPLAAEYLIESLVDAGALTVCEDGSVIGLVPVERQRKDPKDAVSQWKETWPNRSTLLTYFEDAGAQDLKTIRSWLAEDKEPCGHWIVLHSLWRLMKDGEVVKSGSHYDISQGRRASIEAELARDKRNDAVMTEVLRQVGEPYLAEKVVAALRERKDHTWFEQTDWEWTQGSIDNHVEFYLKRGERKARA